jgi:hypothetical protein
MHLHLLYMITAANPLVLGSIPQEQRSLACLKPSRGKVPLWGVTEWYPIRQAEHDGSERRSSAYHTKDRWDKTAITHLLC